MSQEKEKKVKMRGDEPAFPRPFSVSHGGVSDHQHIAPDFDGMTLRQWYAGQAIAGMARIDFGVYPTIAASPADIARRAFDLADAMIEVGG